MKSSFNTLVRTAMESFPDGPDVFLLQIGAGDGVTGDFLYPYLTQKRWRALLLEPHAPAFAQLCHTYRDFASIQCIQMAVSDRDGLQEFYSVSDTDGLPWWANQIQSLRSDVILSHQTEIPDLKNRLEVRHVPCQTVASLIALFSIAQVDIVAVDAEGLDALIVADLLSAGKNPDLLLFEHKHLAAEIRQALLLTLQESYAVVEGPYDTLCVRCGSAADRSLYHQNSLHLNTDDERLKDPEAQDRPVAKDPLDIEKPARGP